MTQHVSKNAKASHYDIPIDDVMRIADSETLRKLKIKFLNVEEGRGMLEKNLKRVDDCKELVKEQFAYLRHELDDLERDYNHMLGQYHAQICEAISVAARDAKTLIFETQWPPTQTDLLARFIWEYGMEGAKPEIELFSGKVERAFVDLKSIIRVQMHSRSFKTSFPDRPKLALISEKCLYEYDVQKTNWSGVRLQGEAVATCKLAWDTALAYYSDNLRLLCVGGSSPLTNNTYTVDVCTGNLTENSHMRSCRSGHGLSQYNGKFYAFGGFGGKNTGEKFDPEVNEWSPLGKMRGGHQWFTTCIYKDKIYICGGDSPIIEYFDPLTEEFTEVTSHRLTDAFADASYSVAATGSDMVLVSARFMRIWNTESEVLSVSDKTFKKPFRAVWSCMSPIFDGVNMFMPSQDGKKITKLTLNGLVFTEIEAKKLEDMPAAA